MGIDISARARALGVTTEPRSFETSRLLSLPQRIAVIAQGSTTAAYATTKRRVNSALEAGQLYGFGSPIHLAVRELLPQNGDGVGSVPVTIYPLEDAYGAVAATGDITPDPDQAEPAEYRVSVSGILSQAFVIVAADTVATVCAKITAAINGVLHMPVVATNNTTAVDVAAKATGTWANDLIIEIVGGNGETDFTITQPTGGAVNPEVQPALDQFQGVWETLALVALPKSDATALNAVRDAGEGRWGSIVRKPFMAFWGDTQSSVANAITVPEGRKTDRINAQFVNPGSVNLPFVSAARQLARVASMANNNPPTDYGSLVATGLLPGAVEWNYPERDQAVKSGSSTVVIRNGEVVLQDTVTFYHPDGDEDPAYRYVVDIIKLQNIIYNVSAIFEGRPWDGAPLIPDDQPTTNPNARRPKDAKAALFSLTDALALQAIISDPAYSKQNMTATISATNAKRIDIVYPVKLSGNANIIDVSLFFTFFYGAQQAA